MRSAAIGAAAVMTGTHWTPAARAEQAAKEAEARPLGATLSPDLGHRQELERPCDDRARGVL